MKDNAIPFGMDAEEIFASHCAKYGFPVIFNIPAGHGAQNYCLKLNAYTTFDGSYLIQE
jgi:muramoyltetrapeptide carboxypeptidase